MKIGKIYSLVELSLLAALISVTGFIKFPAGFPGAEFQLSAPIAVTVIPLVKMLKRVKEARGISYEQSI